MYLINVVVSNINIYCLCCLNVDEYHICWALFYIKLCIDNHCHKYSKYCKYNISLQFYNIFKAGKFKGLKSHIVKKQANHKTKECIHRQHLADKFHLYIRCKLTTFDWSTNVAQNLSWPAKTKKEQMIFSLSLFFEKIQKKMIFVKDEVCFKLRG